MLILARKKGQIINIGDDIEIHVIQIRDEVVRLGINCPSEIPVYRNEIWDKIKANQSEGGNDSVAEAVSADE